MSNLDLKRAPDRLKLQKVHYSNGPSDVQLTLDALQCPLDPSSLQFSRFSVTMVLQVQVHGKAIPKQKRELPFCLVAHEHAKIVRCHVFRYNYNCKKNSWLKPIHKIINSFTISVWLLTKSTAALREAQRDVRARSHDSFLRIRFLLVPKIGSLNTLKMTFRHTDP